MLLRLPQLPVCKGANASGREGTGRFRLPFLAVKSRGPKQLLYGQRNGVRSSRCLHRLARQASWIMALGPSCIGPDATHAEKVDR